MLNLQDYYINALGNINLKRWTTMKLKHLRCFFCRSNIPGHPYRGYIILSKTGELSRSNKWYDGERKPACFVFSGASEEWLKIGKYLFAIPLFAATIQKYVIVSPF